VKKKENGYGRVERATDAKSSTNGRRGERPRRGEQTGQESCEYPIMGGYCGIITPLAVEVCP